MTGAGSPSFARQAARAAWQLLQFLVLFALGMFGDYLIDGVRGFH